MDNHPIIFFDGVCGLCNSFIDWVMRRDRHDRFRFATLQGETAKSAIQGQPSSSEEWTVVLKMPDGQMFERSTAALKVFVILGGFWKGAGVFLILPTGFRDWFYRVIARNRYKWFNRRETCRIPTEEEKGKFLP